MWLNSYSAHDVQKRTPCWALAKCSKIAECLKLNTYGWILTFNHISMVEETQNTQANNKRIVKNTAFLYLRMLLMLFISFFTSRIVLQSLGIVDYGIYNVVGGVVAMFSFFNSALSGATARFLSFELGTGDTNKLKRTFASALTIHIGLGIFIVLLLETIGLWFMYNKLNVPTDRLGSAIIVFHISALTCFFNIIQVPFNASVTSHEKMSAFAYISIYDAIVKLLIVYALYVFAGDRLILYAILLMCTTLTTNLIYFVYCYRNFQECRLSISLDKAISIPILKYSGWDLYGNLSVMVRGQGLNVLQNLFFGPVVNASTGVANTVLAAIMGFTENFLTAVRPQIIKQYAARNYDYFQKMVVNSAKYSFYLLLVTTLPLIIEADYAMGIWLKEVPQYAVIFCQLSIINNWISIIYRPIVISITATGEVRRISFINGTTYLLVLPATYVLLKLGYGPTTPFLLNIFFLFIGHTIFSMLTVKKQLPFFEVARFFKSVLLKCTIVILVSVPVPALLHHCMDDSLARFITVCTVSVIWTCITLYSIGIGKNERIALRNIINNKILKRHIL